MAAKEPTTAEIIAIVEREIETRTGHFGDALDDQGVAVRRLELELLRGRLAFEAKQGGAQ